MQDQQYEVSEEAIRGAYAGAMEDKALLTKQLAAAEKRIRELDDLLGIGPNAEPRSISSMSACP